MANTSFNGVFNFVAENTIGGFGLIIQRYKGDCGYNLTFLLTLDSIK